MSFALGRYPALRHIARNVERLAQAATPLVIIGEPGVGKTLIARAIHEKSPHRKRPLRILNVSILAGRDQRIELLGAEPPEVKSARRGVLEGPSTVVVKHIDYAAAFVQDAFARALTDGCITRLGAARPVPVLARAILTLARRPVLLYKEGRMTRSLLEVLGRCPVLFVPPLRQRGREVPLLLRDLLSELGRPPMRGASMRLLAEVLKAEEWRDNITELKAFLRSIHLDSPVDVVRERERREIERMVMMVDEGKEFSLRRALGTIELSLVRRALGRAGGSRARAARLLGLSDRSIRRFLGKLQS